MVLLLSEAQEFTNHDNEALRGLMQSKRNYWHLIGFILVCYAVAAFGSLFAPGDWYQGLNRAPWNPPNLVFPIVWTILYAMIAVAGWLIFASDSPGLKLLWATQLLLNGIWSWLFFGQHWVGVALVDILLLAAVLLILISRSFKQNQKVVGLLAPYFLWILLATSLNAYIFIYN